MSQYARLVTSVFDEVHAISFDEGDWVDFASATEANDVALAASRPSSVVASVVGDGHHVDRLQSHAYAGLGLQDSKLRKLS